MPVATHRLGRPPPQGAEQRVGSRVSDLEKDAEKWRGDTGWTTVGVSTNYVGNVRYKRDGYGAVWVQNYISTSVFSASGDTVATLPVGMRPSQTLRFATGGNTNADTVVLDVQADGQIKCYWGTKPGAFSVDTIHFPAEQ